MNPTCRFTTSPHAAYPVAAGAVPAAAAQPSPLPAHPAPPRADALDLVAAHIEEIAPIAQLVVDYASPPERRLLPGVVTGDARFATHAAFRQLVVGQLRGASHPAALVASYVGVVAPTRDTVERLGARLPALTEDQLLAAFDDFAPFIAKRMETTNDHFAPVYWVTRGTSGQRVGVPAHMGGPVDDDGEEDSYALCWLVLDCEHIDGVALDPSRCVPAPDGSVMYLLDSGWEDDFFIPLAGQHPPRFRLMDLANLYGQTVMAVPHYDDGGMPCVLETDRRELAQGAWRFRAWGAIHPADGESKRSKGMSLYFGDALAPESIRPVSQGAGWTFELTADDRKLTPFDEERSPFLVPDPRPTPWQVVPPLSRTTVADTFAAVGGTCAYVVAMEGDFAQVFRDSQEPDPALGAASAPGCAPREHRLLLGKQYVDGFLYTVPAEAPSPCAGAIDGQGASFDTLAQAALAMDRHVWYGRHRFQLRDTETDETGLLWVHLRGKAGSAVGTGVTQMQSSALQLSPGATPLADFRVPFLGDLRRPFVLEPRA